MKQKFIVSVLLCVFFISSVVPAAAATSEEEAELIEELNELTESLTEIGAAISNSPDLTEEESYALMVQLVDISAQILEIEALFKPIPTTVLDEYEEADNDRATPAEAKLELLTLTYDSPKKNATATLNFSTTTKRHSYKLVPPENASYGTEIDLVTEQALDDLASRYGIIRGDMAQMLRLTSRHPARDTTTVKKNSALAEEMATYFGLRSIVDRIEVRPSDGGGLIDFYSDQAELMRLTLDKNYDSDNNFLGTYTYRVLYFLTDDYDWNQIDNDGNPIPPTPEYELFADDVLDEDITEVTQSITDYVPFASSITNFDQKLVDFMTENKIYYKYEGSITGNESVLDCYYDSDKHALSEFLLYILQGIDASYKSDVVDTAIYRAPAQYEEYGWNTCVNKKRYF